MNKIEKIEIELHSMCNLKCNFCINKFRDNHLDRIEMTENILNKIYEAIPKMTNLKIVTMQLFNQPILNYNDIKIINEVISKIKKISNSKDIRYRISSNMTHTKEMNYDDILLVNVDEYYLTKYRKDDPSMHDLIINIPNMIDFFRIKEYGLDTYWIKFCFNDIEKIIQFKDFSIYENNVENFNNGNVLLTSRGGVLKDISAKKRKFPCYKKMIVVSYDGNVSGCCDIYPNLEVNKKYVFGNMLNYSLEELISNNIALKFYSDKQCMDTLPRPCVECSNGKYIYKIDEIYEKNKINRLSLY